MFKLRSDTWIIIYLNILRLLGVLPCTWEYRKPKLGSQTTTSGIKKVNLSFKILFLSVFGHVFILFVNIFTTNKSLFSIMTIYNYLLSSTMIDTIYIFNTMFAVYYFFLVLAMIIKARGLLKVFMKNDIFFTTQWDTCGITMFFIAIMISICVNFSTSIFNFVRIGLGIIEAVTIYIVPSICALFSNLYVLLFYFCSKTIGNGWKNIEFEKKELSRNTPSQNHAIFHMEKAARNASYLNSLQKDINEIFTETISLIISFSLCMCIASLFGLISEIRDDIYATCGTASGVFFCITIFILCCNSSRTSEIQGIHYVYLDCTLIAY